MFPFYHSWISALLLYLAVTLVILWSWSRAVTRIPLAAAIAIVLLPLVPTGRSLVTGRVFGAADLAFASQPLKDYEADYGAAVRHNGALFDVFSQEIPWRAAVRWSITHGRWPLWNPFTLCGDLLAGAAQPAPYDPFNLLGLLISLPESITFAAAITFFLAAFGAFVYIREIGCSLAASVIGAAAFMSSGGLAFFVLWPLGRSWALLPLVLFGVRAVTREPGWKSAVVLTGAFVVSILAGHPETMPHLVAVGGAYGLFELAAARRPIASVAVALACGAIALAMTSIFWMPFVEGSRQTAEYRVRRDIYAPTSYITFPDDVAKRAGVTFFPFFGGQPWRGDATKQWTPDTGRVGSIVLALAIFAALATIRRRRETLFFTLLAMVCLDAGFGAPPVAHLLHALPLFSITLNERLIFAASFALCLLAAIAVDEIEGLRPRGAAILAGVCAVLGAATWIVARGQIAAGVDRSVISLLAAAELAPLAVAAIVIAAKVPMRHAALALLALLLLQRTIEDGSIYASTPVEAFYPRIPLIEKIPTGGAPFRIASEHFSFVPNTSAVYGLEDVRGYEALTFKRLVDTYRMWCTPQPIAYNMVTDLRRPFLSLMNVRYAFQSKQDPVPAGWRAVAEDRESRLVENSRALPRVFAPRRIRYAGAGRAVREMLEASDFGELSWIEADELGGQEAANGTAEISFRRDVTDYDIDARMKSNGWLVISECNWKGWRAYVDGRRVRHRFADHAFIGVWVPAGRHRVTLSYLPDTFQRSRVISAVTALLAAAALVTRSATRRATRRTPLPPSRSEG